MPAIPAGTNSTYSQCRVGNASAFGRFSSGATTFTVDPAPAGTDTASSPAGSAAAPGRLPIVVVFVTILLLMLVYQRRRCRVERIPAG